MRYQMRQAAPIRPASPLPRPRRAGSAGTLRAGSRRSLPSLKPATLFLPQRPQASSPSAPSSMHGAIIELDGAALGVAPPAAPGEKGIETELAGLTGGGSSA